jgi:hypothetical protein
MQGVALLSTSQVRSSTGMMHSATARRAHEETATLLAAMDRHAPVFARTYCLPILHVLLPLLQTSLRRRTPGR